MPRWTLRTAAALVAVLPLLGLATAAASADDSGGPVVKVGTEGTYPPFTYEDQRTKKLTGYDIEVARAVADRAGWRLRFVQAPFDAIFPALDAKRVDMIANQVTITPERQAKYLFSTPYTVSSGVIVTRADDDSVHSLADVKGKSSAQSTTSSFAQVATQAGAQVQPVEGFTQAITLLKQKRVDVTINDSLALLEYQKTTGDKSVKIAAKIDPPTKQAFVFRKNEAALQTQVDGALKALKADGTLARISEKYFGEDVSGE